MIACIHTGPFGVNTYIVSLEGSDAFIIDPACCSFCGDENKVTSFLKQQGLTPRAVILTHGHFDHVAGIPAIKNSFPDIPVLISKEDACFIGQKGNSTQTQMLRYIGFEDFIPSVTNLPEADTLLENSMKLSDCITAPGAEKWQVISTPGHTEGCICLYNQTDRILISGDTLFYGSCGRTDFPGGSEKKMEDSLSFLKQNIPGNTKVYPGHDYFGFEMNEWSM